MFSSIIIPAYNEENYIERCINSLENQTIPNTDYEILVIDGGSKDKTLEMIRELNIKYNNIKIINNPKKIQSIGINLGFAEAKGDYIFTLGAHSEYPDNFIENSLNSIISEKVDCVGGKIIMKGNTKIGDVYATVRNTPFGGGLSPYRYSTRKQLVDTVAFGCYTREIFERVHGFNEGLIKNSDNDFNKRIVQAGGKILFDPSIEFYYFTRDDLKGIYKQMFNYGFWEAKLIKKEKEQFGIATIVPSVFVLYTAIAVIAMLMGSFLLLAIEFIPYLLVFSYFAVKLLIPRRQNILTGLFLYLVIHFAIGIGFIKGLFDTK